MRYSHLTGRAGCVCGGHASSGRYNTPRLDRIRLAVSYIRSDFEIVKVVIGAPLDELRELCSADWT